MAFKWTELTLHLSSRRATELVLDLESSATIQTTLGTSISV